METSPLFCTLFLIAALVSPANALKDCNAIGPIGQLEERLQCLQENNKELEGIVADLTRKVSEISRTTLRPGQRVVLRSLSGMCLHAENGTAAHALQCLADGNSNDHDTFTLIPSSRGQ
jgi:hypothetical protein